MFEARRAYPLVLISLILALITSAKLFLWLAVLLIAFLIIRPGVLEPLVSPFEAIMRFLGTLISNVVLSIIFLVLVVPYGFLYRLVEKRLVRHFFNAQGRASYFIKTPGHFDKERFEKLW